MLKEISQAIFRHMAIYNGNPPSRVRISEAEAKLIVDDMRQMQLYPREDGLTDCKIAGVDVITDPAITAWQLDP